MSWSAVAPPVITGCSVLGGTCLGGFLTSWTQRRDRREVRRGIEIEALARYIDSLDTLVKAIQRGFFLADGAGSNTAKRTDSATTADLHEAVIEHSAAHTRVMLMVSSPHLRSTAEHLSDNLFEVVNALTAWELPKLNRPGLGMVLSDPQPVADPYNSLVRVQDGLDPFMKEIRVAYPRD